MNVAGLDPRAAALASDRAEAAAFVDLWAAAPAPLRERLGLRTRNVAGATLLIAAHLPTPMFNRALGLGWGRALSPPSAKDDVDVADDAPPATLADAEAIAAAFRAEGVAEAWLHWNPHGRPAGFEEVLRAHGWTQPRRPCWAKMLRDATPPPRIETSLHVGLARPDETAATTQAIARAFEMPPVMSEWLAALQGRPRWRLYAIRDGERPVGGGCLFVDGALAWLGMGSVLPDARCRGGQGASMARRIVDAAAAGASAIATETGEPVGEEANPSLANMRRCGFVQVASRLNFIAPVPEQQARPEA